MTTALLVARMGSSRLPGKSMRPIAGRPMIEWIFKRVSRARSVAQIALATTDRPEDDPLAGLAARLGVLVYRGQAEDVLNRVCGAAKEYGADPIVELLGDNPLVDAPLIDDVVRFFQEGLFDYAATVTQEYPHAPQTLRRFLLGVRVQVFSRQALELSAQGVQDASHREHSTSFIYEHPELFRLGYFEAKGRWKALNRPEVRLSVNTEEDLRLMEAIFARSGGRDPHLSLEEAVRAYDLLEERCRVPAGGGLS